MTRRDQPAIPSWDRPEIVAAVEAAPHTPTEYKDAVRRVMSDGIDGLYAARKATAKRSEAA
jgi:hypothetical protein